MRFIALAVFLLIGVISHAQEVDSTFIQLEQELLQATTQEKKIEINLKIGKRLLNTDIKKAQFYLNESEQLIDNVDFQNLGLLWQYSSNLERKKGNYSKSSEFAIRSIEAYEKVDDTSGMVRSLISLGISGRFRKTNRQSINYFEEGIKLSEANKDTALTALAYNMMGIAYRRLKLLDSALICYNKAMSLSQNIDDQELKSSISSNLAVFYNSQNQYDKALPLFLKNLEYHKDVENSMPISINYYNIARSYYRKKDYTTARKYADSSFQVADRFGFLFRIAKAAHIKGQILAKTGDFESSLEYYKLYHKISDSLFDVDNEKKLKEFELNRAFDLERKELEINTKAQRAKIQSYVILLVFLLILGSIIAYLLIRNYKGKIKYVDTKLEKQRLEKELLNEKIRSSEQELKWLVADNQMRLTYLQEFYDKLKSDLDTNSSKESNDYIRSLMLGIQQQITTEEKLTNIQSKVNDMNANFDAKLVKEFPKLTKAEREVCALLRVNLSIKEVASIRNTTIESVKSIRYRIRKKMNIPKNSELESFIQGL